MKWNLSFVVHYHNLLPVNCTAQHRNGGKYNTIPINKSFTKEMRTLYNFDVEKKNEAKDASDSTIADPD